MRLADTIAKRLQEVYLDGKWIANTNYKDQLTNTSMEMATSRVGSLNTIAELTYHINYYLSGLVNVLNGGELTIRDKYSFDLHPINTEDDWQQLVSALLINAEVFIMKVRLLSNDDLHTPFVKEEYGTYLRNLEGVIEHSYYHLGQISIIKKCSANRFPIRSDILP